MSMQPQCHPSCKIKNSSPMQTSLGLSKSLQPISVQTSLCLPLSHELQASSATVMRLEKFFLPSSQVSLSLILFISFLTSRFLTLYFTPPVIRSLVFFACFSFCEIPISLSLKLSRNFRTSSQGFQVFIMLFGEVSDQ